MCHAESLKHALYLLYQLAFSQDSLGPASDRSSQVLDYYEGSHHFGSKSQSRFTKDNEMGKHRGIFFYRLFSSSFCSMRTFC